MLNTLRKRLDRDEEGFTLIELMVVVLIIAILIAIAIPTFLGAQNRARDRSAQSTLRNALSAAKTIATDNEGFFVTAPGTPIDAVAMEAAEPSLTYAAAGGKGVVGVKATALTGAVITLTTQSASGKFYGIESDSNGNVTYCKASDADPALDTCNATSF
ncbi:MAG: prepilin-type N-terminal cleavage/methylation domain-containing protein [Actinomycetota bacterium]|nr:prepilin-type N-terminal cleavage/methylation domain-containing protein [Actinomycetota bacterium]